LTWTSITGEAAVEEEDEVEEPAKKKQKKEKGNTLKAWLQGKLKAVIEHADAS
jgi:hypothetical protein